MGKPTGFLDFERRGLTYRPAEQRVDDWKQVAEPVPEEELVEQFGLSGFSSGPGCVELEDEAEPREDLFST